MSSAGAGSRFRVPGNQGCGQQNGPKHRPGHPAEGGSVAPPAMRGAPPGSAGTPALGSSGGSRRMAGSASSSPGDGQSRPDPGLPTKPLALSGLRVRHVESQVTIPEAGLLAGALTRSPAPSRAEPSPGCRTREGGCSRCVRGHGRASKGRGDTGGSGTWPHAGAGPGGAVGRRTCRVTHGGGGSPVSGAGSWRGTRRSPRPCRSRQGRRDRRRDLRTVIWPWKWDRGRQARVSESALLPQTAVRGRKVRAERSRRRR